MMSSVRRHHRDWEIFIFNENSTKRLGLDLDHLKSKCVNWAGVSNIVRLHAVNQLGGIWMDTDVEVLKPFTPLLNHKAFAARQDEDRLCNAVFGAVAGHPWIKWQIQFQNRLMTQNAAEGVFLMTEAPRDGLEVLPTPWIYPFFYDFPPERKKAHPSSFCVHHWDGSWNKNK